MAIAAHKPFIFSRATASALIAGRGRHKSGQIQAPVNFRKGKAVFKVSGERIFFQDEEPGMQIPEKILDAAAKKNLAYELQVGPEKRLLIEALSYASRDGEVFQLKEPEQETEIVGPILELSGIKMHVSKNYKNTLEFSKKLARAANIKSNSLVLDMFLGLGYTAAEALALGARRVVCFEKYPEVVQLVRKNPFSPSLDQPTKISYVVQDVTKTKAFLAQMQELGLEYDSCVMDPAKKNVMLHVYSPDFLTGLAKHLKPGASVVAYVPDAGISPRFHRMREDLLQLFEATKRYKFVENYEGNKHIYCFRRTPS